MGQVLWVSSANPIEILSSDNQRQVSIRTAPNDVHIKVILTVILPEADRTNLIGRRFANGEVSTARARVVSNGTCHRGSIAFEPNVSNVVVSCQSAFSA